MKNKLVAILIILISLASQFLFANQSSNIIVFSDVDDTIRISYVRHHREIFSYLAFTDNLFYGMNLVYQALASSNQNITFEYVSNGWTPTVDGVHRALLNDFSFPNKENYHSRNLKKIIKKYPHKRNLIVDIAKARNPGTIVLIGDNGENDPKVYFEIATLLNDYF